MNEKCGSPKTCVDRKSSSPALVVEPSLRFWPLKDCFIVRPSKATNRGYRQRARHDQVRGTQAADDGVNTKNRHQPLNIFIAPEMPAKRSSELGDRGTEAAPMVNQSGKSHNGHVREHLDSPL